MSYEIMKIWEAVKENNRKLSECEKHKFNLPEPPYNFKQKCICENCKGEMDLINIRQYILGYIAAGGDPNEVCPGFME